MPVNKDQPRLLYLIVILALVAEMILFTYFTGIYS
jgi:hypothetical protein